MRFVPLRVYSGYSFLQSGLTIDKIAQSAKSNGYFGVGLSDNQVMFGIPEFITTMEAIKLPYIIGMEMPFYNNTICVYVLNEEGYNNLSHLSSLLQSKIFSEGEFEKEFEKYKKGLLCVLDTSKGEVKEKFTDVLVDELTFARYLADFSNHFEVFYLGIEIKEREEISYVNRLRNFAVNHTYDVVAFPHVKYQKKNDAIVLDITDAISKDLQIDIKEKSGNEYFMKEADYLKIYTSKEIDNTVKILKMSTFEYHQKRGEMLVYPVSDSVSFLKESCYQSLKEKGLDNNQEYIDRLEYELSVIIEMGYADYFLIVQDYVNYARSQDILVGLRGSAAGSLVTYLLGIAVLDPIKYKLQFERFLNPSRKTMPDIDIDFMDIRRGEVIEYTREKYGQDRVANIITYQSILAKQALRDIGRIYNYPTRHIDLLSKSLTNYKLGLRDSYRQLPAFKQLVDSDKYFLEIVSLASKIEGLPRQQGLHAAGVILNNTPIVDAMPVIKDTNGNLISQYEMNYLEEQGFLKMDFLGLTHLTIISRCVDIINELNPDVHLDKFNIPYDDKEAFDLICSCNTMGIFQLESTGMKNAIRTLKPQAFMDVAALLALYRPGPMDSIPSYARRKAGKEKVPAMRKEVEEILGPTYGIIVYQEQITELAVAMASMSMAQADNFRRAVSKKKTDIFLSMQSDFIEGCLKNGYSKAEADDYFKRISAFASYGFNKSHAVGYAYLSCQMAYLKAHYPLEFYLAILENSSTTSDTKFNEYVSEMKKRNINILPIDINECTDNFKIKENGILFPLNGIKDINLMTARNIIEARKDGPFADIFDFCIRLFPYKISEKQVERLIDSGAFDKLHSSRETLRTNILSAMQFAEMNYGANGQTFLSLGLPKPSLREEHDDQLENLDKEYEAIGIMLSNNPLHFKKDLLDKENVTSISEALASIEESDTRTSLTMTVAGIVRSKRVINTKKGTPMAFVKIFDETGELEVTIFSDKYTNEVIQMTEKNNIVLIQGRFERNKGNTSFIASEIRKLED